MMMSQCVHLCTIIGILLEDDIIIASDSNISRFKGQLWSGNLNQCEKVYSGLYGNNRSGHEGPRVDQSVVLLVSTTTSCVQKI